MIVETFKVKQNKKVVQNKRFLSLAERYGKPDNIAICQRKEVPER
jgi:hypothetical protein